MVSFFPRCPCNHFQFSQNLLLKWLENIPILSILLFYLVNTYVNCYYYVANINSILIANLEVGTIIFPILQMDKPRNREIKELTCSHSASKPGFKTTQWLQSPCSEPLCLISLPHLRELTIFPHLRGQGCCILYRLFPC